MDPHMICDNLLFFGKKKWSKTSCDCIESSFVIREIKQWYQNFINSNTSSSHIWDRVYILCQYHFLIEMT